ncbi:hypothetical protein GGQ00_003121 [Salinibacter ruber]|uniref:Uncharacterized protein n=1 Tax=Salinibacter ruber TaxID=146919 RepID=A0AAW5PCR5_9BACT|nr:hypothetical protein [Salinibacter ruber]MCS4155773.1 hypothetical protein [Salinibacter ruber]MCS4159244.1 hypothetical protein [Salinibacter ruber]MCS4223762.1 hypothetical protein [Salinibacter ruber]
MAYEHLLRTLQVQITRELLQDISECHAKLKD